MLVAQVGDEGLPPSLPLWTQCQRPERASGCHLVSSTFRELGMGYPGLSCKGPPPQLLTPAPLLPAPASSPGPPEGELGDAAFGPKAF